MKITKFLPYILLFSLLLISCQDTSGDKLLLRTYSPNLLKSLFGGAGSKIIMADGTEGPSYRMPKKIGIDPTWSPDGQWIVTHFGGDRAGSHSDLFLINVLDDTRIQLTDDTTGQAYPVWAPDGQKIAYEQYHQDSIYTMDVGCLLYGQECNIEPLFLSEGRSPAWSPDGHYIAFDRPEGCEYSCDDPCELICKGGVYIIDSVGTSLPDRISPENLYCVSPQWSPDGERIVASCDEGLIIFYLDGREPTNLGIQGGHATWSPDGASIYYLSSDTDDLGEMLGWESCWSNALFKINIEEKEPERLTHDKRECIRWYRWLPQGSS
ncbi:MAG: hypothetical protein U9N80_13035 [Chloroflexota bacterium]|nr:hypothetical protein [Chloroflexota bacterium]